MLQVQQIAARALFASLGAEVAAIGILVGDVGGTNVRFALAVRDMQGFRVDAFRIYPGDRFSDFETALDYYLNETGLKPMAACFAFAGPVRDQSVEMTNRNWGASAQHLARRFGIGKVHLINDFHAMARGVAELSFDQFEVILPGTAVEKAPVLVAGPGTGFGVATLLSGGGGKWSVLAGEGGHVAYAPRTDMEWQLASILRREGGYVSNELVASGSGLEAVHAAFCEIYGRGSDVKVGLEQMLALADGGDEMYRALVMVRALAVMGAVGDFVLANGARGGVVLAGGVSEHLARYLSGQKAAERFVSRGPMSSYLKTCPVWLMRDPLAPLIGAGAFFAQFYGI